MGTVKNLLPNIAIDWVVRDCFADIVRASGIVDRIFLFHRRGGFRKFCALVSEIRKVHYDYILDMQGLARTGIMTHFSRANQKLGRSDARELAWLVYDRKISFPAEKSPHAIDILLQFLPELRLPAKLDTELQFSVTPGEEVRAIFSNFDTLRIRPIALFPESRRKSKEWPYFNQLVHALSEQLTGLPLVIAGQGSFTTSVHSSNIYNLSGRTDINDLIYIVQNSTLIVANDSAPVHLAAAMRVPVIALFGPTDPKKFGPYCGSEKNCVLQAKDSKLSSISVTEVTNEILQRL
jgi:ADP-heptose:LPS heptosyltransferase